jgi:FtsP/CotA-like multicopper oxidase with cupredoxin domain
MIRRAKKTVGLGACLAALACLVVLATGPASAGSGSQPAVASSRLAAIVPAATVSIDLCAKTGSITLPGIGAVDIWGYALKPIGMECSDPEVVAAIPGPVIDVAKGSDLTVTLHNELAESTSILFPGASAEAAEAASGGTVTYSFTTSDPGTYLYQSGSNVSRQVPMGLYGALVVRAATAGRAYDDPSTAYDTEAAVVLSEIDPNLNADPNGFNLLDWAPTEWLINGKPYPDTAQIPANAGDRVLLRYVNASLDHHTMALLGMHQRVIAKDADALSYPFEVVAETVPAGSTADMIATVPGGASAGSLFPLYNRQLRITNGNAFPGGQLTFLAVQSGAAAPVLGVVPKLLSLRATVRVHKVRVAARVASCRACSARVRMRVRGTWRSLRMVKSHGTFAARFGQVPSGRWRYLVAIRDSRTGIRMTSPTRFVRVR